MTLPSVTQILQPFSGMESIPPDVLAHAAARGTAVHRICLDGYARAFMRGDQDAMDLIRAGFCVPEECRGFVASFVGWFHLAIKKVLFVEVAVVEADFGYCGHPDMGAILNDGSSALLDLKTPAGKHKSWCLQLASYKNAAEKTHSRKYNRVLSVRLDREGKPPRVDEYFAHASHLAIFLGMLNAWKYYKY